MKILFIGDIFASSGRSIVAEHLASLVSEHRVDLVIANAENSAGGFGITPLVAEELLALGIDVLTGGNHSFDKREIFDYLDRQPRLLRPHNYPSLPGTGVFTGFTMAGAGMARYYMRHPGPSRGRHRHDRARLARHLGRGPR